MERRHDAGANRQRLSRRDFIVAFGFGAAAPHLAAAQSPDRIRQIGVLMGIDENAATTPVVTVFTRRLAELGWIEGRTVHFDVRWWRGDQKRLTRDAEELMASHPDVVVPSSNLGLATIQPMLGNTPAVFLTVGDPVGSGFVESLARPGANTTGFLSFEPAMGGKWLEILKETAPNMKRVLVLYHPETPVHQRFWHTIEAAAPRLGIEAVAGGIHDMGEIERSISTFAATPNGGVISLPHAITDVYGDLIVSLERRLDLPSIVAWSAGARAGTLVAYGPDLDELWRQGAGYVDRVLRGEKPGDLPVQAPTKYLLTVNLKTAKEIGLVIPESFLLRADEVIE